MLPWAATTLEEQKSMAMLRDMLPCHAKKACVFFYFVHVYIFMSVLKITWKIVSSTQNLKLDLMRKK